MLIRMAGLRPIDALYHAPVFEDLSFAERLVVWTVRLWMHPNPTGAAERHDMIATAFRKSGVPEAAHAMDGALWALKVGSQSRFTTHCPCTAALSADEIRVLYLLACHQAGAGAAARVILDRMVPEGMVQSLDRPLRLWAAGFDAVGLTLPMRDWDLPELSGTPAGAGTDKTVHLH